MGWIIKQILGFGFVGIVCFIIDYALMVVLTELFSVNYLLSCGISFFISTVVNYALSMKYVFSSKQNIAKSKEFTLFVVMSTIGLVITEILMKCFVDKLKIHYMVSKIAVTGIVMVYNFVTRKIFLDSGKPKR